MKQMHYILSPDHSPVPCHNEAMWHLWMWTSQDERQVAHAVVNGVQISTVFLGIDHSWTGAGPPILFETLVIGGDLDKSEQRYAFWDDAVEGHKQWVARIEGSKLFDDDWPTEIIDV